MPTRVELPLVITTCRVCGCTDMDCRRCIELTGAPCSWTAPDLCSACEIRDPARDSRLWTTEPAEQCQVRALRYPYTCRRKSRVYLSDGRIVCTEHNAMIKSGRIR